jgi:hypothetical protein
VSRKPKKRAPYKMVSPATWALARADYLGGMTAQAVADRHDIGLNNLRQTMARKGWTKRALAEARAMAGPGGPPVADPPPDPIAAARAAAAPPPGGAPANGPGADPGPEPADLLDAVLRRARDSLTAGRGGEATALLKAARDYVLIHQEVRDARAAIARGVAVWDAAQPDRAGEVTEPLLLQTLHDRWRRLSHEEHAERADPHDEMGFRAWAASLPPDPSAAPARKRGR